MKNKEFDKKNLFELRKMTIEELEKYYRDLRKYQHDMALPMKGIRLRKKIHKLTVFLMKIERLLLKHSLTIVGDKRTYNEKPKIYAVTHVGRYDIETAIEAIKENAYFLWGDPGALYKSPEMLLLNAIGMIFVDTDCEEDRHISLDTMVKVLMQNGNVLIYPEGAWNITENEVVMKLYSGVIQAAVLGGAEIIPVAIEYYGNDYYVNIGENIDCSEMDLADKYVYADNLRDTLASLKWEIWEKYGNESRKNIPNYYSEVFLNEIMKDSDNGYTVEEIERTRYKDKQITSPDEAFEHLGFINPTKNTSFLFKNLNSVERERQAKVLKKKY